MEESSIVTRLTGIFKRDGCNTKGEKLYVLNLFLHMMSIWAFLDMADRGNTTQHRSKFKKWKAHMEFRRLDLGNLLQWNRETIMIGTNFAILIKVGKQLLTDFQKNSSFDSLLDLANMLDMFYSASVNFEIYINKLRKRYLEAKAKFILGSSCFTRIPTHVMSLLLINVKICPLDSWTKLYKILETLLDTLQFLHFFSSGFNKKDTRHKYAKWVTLSNENPHWMSQSCPSLEGKITIETDFPSLIASVKDMLKPSVPFDMNHILQNANTIAELYKDMCSFYDYIISVQEYYISIKYHRTYGDSLASVREFCTQIEMAS